MFAQMMREVVLPLIRLDKDLDKSGSTRHRLGRPKQSVCSTEIGGVAVFTCLLLFLAVYFLSSSSAGDSVTIEGSGSSPSPRQHEEHAAKEEHHTLLPKRDEAEQRGINSLPASNKRTSPLAKKRKQQKQDVVTTSAPIAADNDDHHGDESPPAPLVVASELPKTKDGETEVGLREEEQYKHSGDATVAQAAEVTESPDTPAPETPVPLTPQPETPVPTDHQEKSEFKKNHHENKFYNDQGQGQGLTSDDANGGGESDGDKKKEQGERAAHHHENKFFNQSEGVVDPPVRTSTVPAASAVSKKKVTSDDASITPPAPAAGTTTSAALTTNILEVEAETTAALAKPTEVTDNSSNSSSNANSSITSTPNNNNSLSSFLSGEETTTAAIPTTAAITTPATTATATSPVVTTTALPAPPESENKTSVAKLPVIDPRMDFAPKEKEMSSEEAEAHAQALVEREEALRVEKAKQRRGEGAEDNNSSPLPEGRSGLFGKKQAASSSTLGKKKKSDGRSSKEIFAQDPMAKPDLQYPYCKLTNPPKSRKDVTTCISGNPRAMEDFVVVVTISEEELRRSVDKKFVEDQPEGMVGNQLDGTAHYQQSLQTKRPGDDHALSWLADLPLKKHIYVKSNWTKSYRRNNSTWDPKLQEKISGEEMFWEFQEREHIDLDKSDGYEEYRQANAEHFAQKPGKKHVFRSIAHDLLANDPSILSITELPNIADEALSMLWHLENRVHSVSKYGMTGQGLMRRAEFYNLTTEKQKKQEQSFNEMSLDEVGRLSLQGPKHTPRWTIFLHGHAESWHSVDVVREQLACLCMDEERERYKTLTYAERAFLLQCVPLKTPPMITNPKNVIERMEQRMQKNLTFFTKQFRYEWRALLQDEFGPHPTAVIRDCCASLVVHKDHILQRKKSFFSKLYNMSRYQPYKPFLEKGLERDLSLFLERLWRTIFNATWIDNVRDFGNIKCTHANVQRQRRQMAENLEKAEKERGGGSKSILRSDPPSATPIPLPVIPDEKTLFDASDNALESGSSSAASTLGRAAAVETGTSKREYLLFDCPPSMVLKNMDDIPIEYRERRCPPPNRNIFQ